MDATEKNKIKLIKNNDFNSLNGTVFIYLLFKTLRSNFGREYNTVAITAQTAIANKNFPVFISFIM
jgi:hypothetical protein